MTAEISISEAVTRCGSLWLVDEGELEFDAGADSIVSQVASLLSEQFRDFRARDEEVRTVDPWRCGLRIAWMEERIEVSWLPGYDGLVVERSRFEIFQAFGCWDDLSFSDWATQETGKAYKTWQGWKNAAKFWLMSTVGRAWLHQAGVDADDVDQVGRMVNIDKAVRAKRPAQIGLLESHQLVALTAPSVSPTQMRHALNSTEGEWAEKQQEWVDHGSSRMVSGPELVLDGSDIVVYIRDARMVVCILPPAADDGIAEIQQSILDVMRVRVRGDSFVT